MHSTITIIRHAPTEYNKKGIFMGTSDIPIDGFDEESISSVKAKLREQPYSFLYTSPLKRAFDTAKAIVNEESRIVIDDRLIERCLGDWQGISKTEVQRAYPNAFIDGKMDFYYFPENGESYEDVVNRVADFIVDRCRANRQVVVVTHNGVFRVMKSLLTGDRLSNVFSQFEPHLIPCTFNVDDKLLNTIEENPFYTVDR